MLIRCWGARGSIPVSGAEYVAYGGDTTCLEIRTGEDEIIIIDAGSGIRRLGNDLMQGKRRRCHMIFTHAHWDHILGFPFFKPAYQPGTSLLIYGCPIAQDSIKGMISKTMVAPYFPVNFGDLKADISFQETCGSPFVISSVVVTPIPLSHPNGGFGYKFTEDGKSFVFLTDNELSFRHPGGLTLDEYAAYCEKADLLIHDAEFTEEEYQKTRSWGHTEYRDALHLALRAKVKRLGLFHHNQERSDTALEGLVENCRQMIAERAAPLGCFAVSQETEIQL